MLSISVSAGGFSRGLMTVARCRTGIHAVEIPIPKLNDGFNKVLDPPDVREKTTGPGNVAGGGTAEEFGAFIKAKNKRWTALVMSAGIRLE